MDNFTVKKKFERKLVNLGMQESHAIQILDNVVADYKRMEINWDFGANHYPTEVNVALWVTTKSYALEWVNENLPNARYKPLL